jgi:hypothetical protein
MTGVLQTAHRDSAQEITEPGEKGEGLMVGGVEVHEIFLIVTHAPSSTYAGGHTTRSSFIHS